MPRKSTKKKPSSSFFWEEEGDLIVCRKGPFVGSIRRDDDPLNPRDEIDHLCVMMCWHRNCVLGDRCSMQGGWPQGFRRKEFLLKELGPGVVKPLYLYEHSDMTISLSPFGDPFDSGQVGWIYCSYKKAEKEFGKLSKRKLDVKIAELMQREVEEYDQYLTGDVWTGCVELSTELLPDDSDSPELFVFNKLVEESEASEPKSHPECEYCKAHPDRHSQKRPSPTWRNLNGLLDMPEDSEFSYSGYYGEAYAKQEVESMMLHNLKFYDEDFNLALRRFTVDA